MQIAFIGTGNAADAHLKALASVDNAKVRGVFDADESKAWQVAGAYGIDRVYRSWGALLADDSVDLVAILLPHGLHVPYAVEALRAGKHVVCEKPLAADLAGCDAMLEAAASAGRRLFPVHNRVYDEATDRLAALVRDGAVGDVFLAQSSGLEGPQTVAARPWLTTESSGGVLMTQSVHPIYLLRWLLGDVREVFCRFGQRRVVAMAGEDTAIVTLVFASGAVAELTATFGIRHGHEEHAITLYGTDGRLEQRTSRRAGAPPHEVRAVSPRLFGDNETHEVDLPRGDGFVNLWRDFVRAIASETPARVSAEDGKRAVEIIVAAYRSQKTGRVVELPFSP